MPTTPAPDLGFVLGVTLVVYVVFMYALSFAVKNRISDTADFLVAGRRLPLSLAWATILATWFGAGALLTTADEVRKGGLERAALDPVGAGLCLLIAGLFYARPLWQMGLLTVSDFFRIRFGPRAEVLSALILVPSYFGWIAAQLVAIASLLELFLGFNLALGILLTAVVAMGYTLQGGMWSVTLTDAVQIALVFVGLLYLSWLVLAELGAGSVAGGLVHLWSATPPEMRAPIPTGTAEAFLGWISIVAIGALGNLPGQDLLQRVFASKSAKVARDACLVSGFLYLGFGLFPLLLGLSARLLVPETVSKSIVPTLAHIFLAPFPAVVFVVAVVSAVLSTLTSAILSPAGVLAQNVFMRYTRGRFSALTLDRLAVVLVTAASVATAFLGEDTYSLLEDAYELPLVGLFVPLTLGLYRHPKSEHSALASMGVGFGLWVLHYAAGWESFLPPLLGAWEPWLPSSLTVTGMSLLAYLAGERWGRRRSAAPEAPAGTAG